MMITFASRAAVALTALSGSIAIAQETPAAVVLDPVVVTVTRGSGRDFDLPVSVDRIDASTLHDGQPMVNLSETLVRIPGLVALNRQNYAQDLQISSRGFGARATFGVRGIRLYQDDIPATMPDGQGQTGSFSLLGAQRIEVLRGPFSTLYGNASGGVIAVYSENGTPTPEATINVGAGSYGQRTLGAKLTGSASTEMAQTGYALAASRFETDGYREHSAARRDLVNAKLTIDPGADTHIAVVGGYQYQPETQDPLGVTRAQWESNPRAVDPAALQFDTRKTILQEQGGATLEHQFGSGASIKAIGYYGARSVRQYLALSGAGATSSGGVTDLDRNYGGVGVRFAWHTDVASMPLTFTAGIDADQQGEHRRGFVNNDGSMGDLRRDEDDRVTSDALYAQAEVLALPALSVTAGVRSARVRFRSDDHYINAMNPDDSGSRRYSDTSPVFGAVYHVNDSFNLYASYGEGFETPTLIELAYRSAGSGLNFALEPATSRSTEVGMKAFFGKQHRVDIALFTASTRNEIVVDSATGGRTIYKNAGRTERRGVEAMWDARWAPWLATHVAYTALRAVFADDFSTGTPPVVVASGARLPGVPATNGYADLVYMPGGFGGFSAALEVQHTGAIWVNERNSDAAPSWTIGNVRVGFEQQRGPVTLREFARLDNFTARNYVGSVIVGDTNGRYFEPAPQRNWFAGITLRAVF